MAIQVNEEDLPGLYQSANNSSLSQQKAYFNSIAWYILLLLIASLFAFFADGYGNAYFRIISFILFLATLSITIWLRYSRPDKIWYNGRAVAESVKTRAWRWMMRAEPYLENDKPDTMRKEFIDDLRKILKQNEDLVKKTQHQRQCSRPNFD